MKKIILSFLCLLFLSVNAYNLDFFSRFNDTYLENYIKEALLNNHDLLAANRRLEEYRYEVQSALSREFPSLSVSPSYLGVHFPQSDYNIFIQNNSFIMPFKLNWEVDFLLKTKDKIKSKKYLYISQKAIQDATYISLLTDIANNYINILLYDFLINKQNEILENQKENLNFNFNKFKLGVIDSINLNNFYEEDNSQKLIYDGLIKNRKTTLYNFALLLGRSANCINEIKRGKLEDFEYQQEIPDTINSDIIYKRPDLIEIENKLKSAKIDITIAKKDFFPSFNIMGLLSFDTAGGNFFDWSSSFAYLLAGATQDIFKGGEKIANLKIKKAKFYELFEKFKQTDLTAIKEISNALNIIKQDRENEITSIKQLELKKNNFEISSKKLDRGIISKVEYLNNKNSYNQQEQITAVSKANRLADYITLYKAVGGQL